MTLGRLRRAHGSVPHNPLLAEPLYLTQYIERMGTGTGDMIQRCRAAGLREPDFRMADGFTLTLWRRPAAKGKTSGKMPDKIVQLMQAQPGITIPEIARRLNRTSRAIEMQVNKLKAGEVIGRVGPAKVGRWEVLK